MPPLWHYYMFKYVYEKNFRITFFHVFLKKQFCFIFRQKKKRSNILHIEYLH